MRNCLVMALAAILVGFGLSASEAEAEFEPWPEDDPTEVVAESELKGDLEGAGTAAEDAIVPLVGLTLEQATEWAAQSHPEQAFWRAAVEGIDARANQAGKMPNPEFSARMETVPLHRGNVGDSEFLAGVSQEIPTAGKLSKARRVAQADRTRIEYEQAAGWVEIRKRVHGAFAVALYNDQLCALLAAAVEVTERNLAIAKSKVDAGEAVPDEVARAEMERARARLDLERASTLKAKALVELAAAMGLSGKEIESVAGAIEAALELPVLEELAADLERHPRILAAAAEVAAQHARVDYAKAQRIPNVNVDLLYRRVGSERLNALDAGFSISIPLFDGGKARVAEAEADRRAAEAKGRAERIALEGELRSAHLQLMRALQTAKLITEEIVPRSQSLLQTAEARYKAGDASLDQILPIRRDATASKLSHLEALRDVLSAWVELRPFVDKR